MSWKIQVTIVLCDDQKVLQRKHHAHGFRRLEKPFRTIVSVDVGLCFVFFSQIFDPVKIGKGCKTRHIYDILGCMFSAKVDKDFLLTMSCKEKLYLRKKIGQPVYP